MRAKLNKCKCGKTYNLNEVGTTEALCETCNHKVKSEIRRKDALRKSLNRKDSPSVDLEKLADIDV